MLYKSVKDQSVSGAGNVTSGNDTHIHYNVYLQTADTEISGQTVIDDILTFVIDNIKKPGNTVKGKPEKLIKTRQKIERNFKKADERAEVKEYFTHSYTKINLIEEKYRLLDNNVQLEIHGYIFSVYKELKTNKSGIEILRELFKHFLPTGKEKDPQYVSFAKAFVLFFFDDCTIFEKTKQEKAAQTSLFDGL